MNIILIVFMVLLVLRFLVAIVQHFKEKDEQQRRDWLLKGFYEWNDSLIKEKGHEENSND